uniref:Uncharacterized protein n=1 Tax=Globisporangium ultimum (strain ATCC 200006 / CBS 805.95 / DAOM BR144) TaxID=431595 RepID=K3WCK3_GLOUD
MSKCMPEMLSGSLSGLLKSSELVRFGYVIYGDGTDGSACYVLALDDWDMLTMLAPMRIITHLWHYRVLVFEIHTRDGVTSIDTEPKLCHIDDPRLCQIQWWQVSARAIK